MDRDEMEERRAVVAEAMTWRGTPFHMNAMVKGPDGGVDCVRLVSRAFGDSGVIPELAGVDPGPHHDGQRASNDPEDTLGGYVRRYADEVERAAPLPADVILVKRPEDLSSSHAMLVTEWPMALQVMDRLTGVGLVNVKVIDRLWPGTTIRVFDVWERKRRTA